MAKNMHSLTGSHKNGLWFNLNCPRCVTLNKQTWQEIREIIKWLPIVKSIVLPKNLTANSYQRMLSNNTSNKSLPAIRQQPYLKERTPGLSSLHNMPPLPCQLFGELYQHMSLVGVFSFTGNSFHCSLVLC